MAHEIDTRPMGQSLWRGWRGACPNCGKGALMHGYLKLKESCPECGLALSKSRTDDGPAYITILVVGHIIAPIMLLIYENSTPDPLSVAITLTIFAVGLCLYMLPRVKGAMVGFQWSRGLYGL